MKSGIKHNIPKSIRDFEKDIFDIDTGIGMASADLLSLIYKDIHDKGFVRGRQIRRGKKLLYIPFEGANQSRKASNRRGVPNPRYARKGAFVPRPNAKHAQKIFVFQKGKIVERGGHLCSLFRKPIFRRENGKRYAVADGNHMHAEIRRFKTSQEAIYYPTGKFNMIFARFEKSNRKISIQTETGTKRKTVGARPIISKYSRQNLNKWTKFAKHRLNLALAKARTK